MGGEPKRASYPSRIMGNAYFHSYIENGLFIVLLAFWPLIHVDQGLDVADSTYSLGNFQYFTSADGTWQVATYLANALGFALMRLPRGDTLAGMNLYTGLLVSATALICYLALRRKMSSALVFGGEFLAISLCWCPTVILYNYLTYFLMAMGMLLLYRGCLCGRDDPSRRRYLVLAGICLGANVAVRMPNVVQAAFILALWYSAFLRKETFSDTVRDTLRCIAGYAAGFAVPFAAVCAQYGVGAYPEMVRTMFAMTDQAADYKPTSMVTKMLADYGQGLRWLAFAAICMAGLYAVCGLCRALAAGGTRDRKEQETGETRHSVGKGVIADGRIRVWAAALMCLCAWGVLLRFYWGRGMFHFQYSCYDYRAIYWWAVLFLIAGIAGALWMLADCRIAAEDKTLALLALLQILLTPLGSNNGLAPMINNLFLAAPFTLWCGRRLWRMAGARSGREKRLVGERAGRQIWHLPWQIMLLVFGAMFCIQCVGFHRGFVFADGVWGEARDTYVTEPPKAEGVYTNRENAECLEQLAVYIRENGLSDQETILYGEIPGISYLLDMPCAISTAWPDLDSYPLGRLERDMAAVEAAMETKRPVVIVSAGIAAYCDEDAQMYERLGVDAEKLSGDRKLEILRKFLADYGYAETFANMRYAVYE